MLKPRLVKSLITQNATLLREKQQLIDYFRAMEMMLRLIGKNGKDSGVVELKDVFALADDMRGILLSYDLHNSKKWEPCILQPSKSWGRWQKQIRTSCTVSFLDLPMT